MPQRVDKVSGGQLPPSNVPYIQSTGDETQHEISVERKLNLNEVNPINPSEHKNLFRGFRNTASEISGLRKFLIWFTKGTSSSLMERVNEVFSPSEQVEEAVIDLCASYEERGIDLSSTLKNLLVISTNFEEKVQIIKMLLALGKEEELYNEFFIPVLCKRKDFENLENNYEFCCKFLALLDIKKLREILSLLDYTQIGNINEFAASLTRIAEGEALLEELIKISNLNKVEESDDLPTRNRKERIQSLALETCKKLIEASLPLKIETVKKLYKSCTNLKVNKEVCEIIKNNFPGDAPKIFKEQFLDDSDHSNNARLRRSYAINYYSKVAEVYGTNTLKEFIQSEKDPFLVSQATYILCNSCGIDGQRTILSTIVNQIRQNKTSLPLAALTLLVNNGEPFLSIFKNIFTKSYEKESGLREAYLLLMNVELGNIFRNKNNALIFQLGEEIKPEIVVSLVSNIGLEKLLKWASGSIGKYEQENANARKNILDVLDLAWEVNQKKMRELTIGATTNGDNEIFNLFTKLTGMQQAVKAL